MIYNYRSTKPDKQHKRTLFHLLFIVQAFYGQKLVNLPQIATEANSTDMIS